MSKQELQERKKKEVKKNKNSKNNSLSKQKTKSKKGRKMEESVSGIISEHKEAIKIFITLYKKGAMGDDSNLCQASLARFIEERKILLHKVNGEYKPLKYNAIRSYISRMWHEEDGEENNERE